MLMMAVDNVAKVVKVNGKYVVMRRGTCVSRTSYKTEADALKVADRWNKDIYIFRKQ